MDCGNLDIGNYVIAPKTGEGISTVYREDWIPGKPYDDGEIVRREGYLSIVREGHGITYDSPIPEKIGDAQYLYSGDIADDSVSAKQVLIGTRYAPQVDIFVSAARVDTVIGNHYVLYSVADPLGTPIIKEIANFTATTSGWTVVNVDEVIVIAGTIFDAVVQINEPDATPTTWVGNWNYITGNNTTVPLNGQITHSDKDTDLIRVNSIDNDGGNRLGELAALSVGDIINLQNGSWSIQSIVGQSTYYDFYVSPTTQAGPDGVTEVTFETVTATPISYGYDAVYNSAYPNVNGLYIVDGAYENIAVNENAYGVDILIQEGTMSDDWHVLAHSTGVASSTSGSLAYFYNKVSDIPVPSVYPGTPHNTLTTPPLAAGVYEIGYAMEMSFNNHKDKPIAWTLTGDFAGEQFSESVSALDSGNVKSRYYAFPKEVNEGDTITHGIMFYDQQGNNNMVVSFSDVFIKRVQ